MTASKKWGGASQQAGDSASVFACIDFTIICDFELFRSSPVVYVIHFGAVAMLDSIDQIRAAVLASNMLVPTDSATTPKGKIERIRFALSRFDMPFGCENSEHKHDCPECANIFLEVCRDVLNGKGLPGE